MRGKKLLSLILSLVLAVSMIGAVPAKAADSYTNIKFTGIADGGIALSGDCWHFYLTAENYSGDEWNYKYEGFKYEIEGVEGTAAEVSSAGGTTIWFKIAASDVNIEEGTILTIKAGNYEPGANSSISTGLCLTEDFNLVYSGSEWLANLNIVDVEDGQQRQFSVSDTYSDFYFYLKDSEGNNIGPGTATWDYWLAPTNNQGARVTELSKDGIYSGIYLDGALIQEWSVYTDFKYIPDESNSFFLRLHGCTITTGTTLTIKGFFSPHNENWEAATGQYYFFREFSFRYDGSSWSFVKPTTYTNVTLTGTYENVSAYNTEQSQWNLYLTNSGAAKEDNWSHKYKGFTYELNGNTYTTGQVSTTESGLYNTLYCSIPGDVLPSDAADGTKIVIKAGNYDWDDANEYQGLTIQNDLTLIVQDGKLINKTIVATPTFDSGNGVKGIYFSTDESTFPYDSANWSYITTAVDEEESGVFLNGVKKASNLKKYGVSAWYADTESWSSELKENDIITLRGNFIYSATDGSTHRIQFNSMSFICNGTTFGAYSAANYSGSLTVAGAQTPPEYKNTEIYLKGTDGYNYGSTTEDWSDTYKFTANGNKGSVTVDGKEVSASFKKYHSSNNHYYLAGLTDVSEGSVVTVSGEFINSTGTVIITFEESKFEWNGSCWVDYVPVYQGVLSYGDGANSSNSTVVYLETTDEMNVDSWNYAFYGKDRASGDSAEHGIWLDGIYQTGAQMKKVGGRYYVEGFGTAQTNSILTIQGTFVSDEYTAAKVSFTKAQFQWNGSTWSNYIEKQTYDGTLTVSGAETTACNNDRIYLRGTDAYTYETTNENLQDWDNHKFTGKVTVGDSTIEVTLIKYSSANNWYYIGGLSGVEKGSVLTIGGDFVKTDNTVVITFEQSQFTWDGSNWKDYVYVETKYYEGTPKLYSAVNGEFGSASGFYFQSEDGAPCDDTWTDKWTACDGDDNGVFINGTKYNIPLKKFGTNNWYVAIIDCEEKNSVVAGDVVTIKGQICFENNIVTFAEKTFTFTGTHFQEGTFTTSGVTLTGLRYSQISYDESAGLWKMYFTSDSDIPGDVGTIYPFVEYSINGTSYTANAVKTLYTESEETKYALYIPMQELPQSLEQEYGIIIKECTSQGRYADTTYAREDGISLVEYIFTVGTGFGPSAPTIDTATASGGDANGIFLASGDDFPNLGWECALTQVGNTGITVDYDGDGTYEASNYYMKKVGVSTYYLSMTDGGHSAAKPGTVVMLKGSYTYQTLYTATFKTVKYVYKDGQWEVYKATITETTSSVIGDAIGDEEITNSQDLVRVKRFLASEADTIDMAADLNSSGNIDTYDAGLLRWLLVNGADNNYVNGSRISGVPTYTNEDDYMRLAAYVSPEAEDTDGMASYKAAGLTTLISEHKASYENEKFATYMQNAKDTGLDVLVESSQIRTMGESGGVNQTLIKEIHEALVQYDNFRGYYLGDEPNISELETYTQVVNTLKTADPDVELYMAGWPTYVEDETALSTDISLDLNEKYAAYATSWGNLLGEFGADFYPFRYEKSSWFTSSNTVREDWFTNLELVAASGKGAYTTGITVQSHEAAAQISDSVWSCKYYRTTGYEDISFQVYSALAYGAKYINYFTYGDHWEDTTMSKSMATDSTIYNAVKNVNEEIAAIDHILLNFNWQGTIGKAVDNDDLIMDNVNMNGYSSSRIKEWTTATNDTIIGCLKDVNAYDGFMIVNATDPIDGKESTVSVTFNNATNAKVYVKGVEVTASNYITVDKANKTITFNATLTHGQGIFVIPYME